LTLKVTFLFYFWVLPFFVLKKSDFFLSLEMPLSQHCDTDAMLEEVRGVANSGGAAVKTPLVTEEVGSVEASVRQEAPDELGVAPDGLAAPGDNSVSKKLDTLINLIKNTTSNKKLDDIINLLKDKETTSSSIEIPKVNDKNEMVNYVRLSDNLVDLINFNNDLIVEDNETDYLMYCKLCNDFISLPQRDRPLDFIVPKGGTQGCLSRGLKVSKCRYDKLLKGKCQDWHSFKYLYKNHFCDSSSSSCHQMALNYFKSNKKIVSPTVLVNHIKAAVTLIKTKAASQCFEEQMCTLKVCGASVGDFGFSRKNLNDIMKCLNIILNNKFETYLKTNLKSTLMRPHLFLTADKSTKHRQTTQIVMLSCVVDGVRQAFPVDLLDVYENSDGTGATMPDLATRSVESIKNNLNFSNDDLNYIQGKAADGQYVRSEFNKTLIDSLCSGEILNQKEVDYFMPIVWDSAHWIDLIFNKVRDHPETKLFINNFINKISSINKMFHAGKLFTLSEHTASDLKMQFKRVSNVAPHRFLSSNYKLMNNLFDSLPVLIETFRDHKNTDDGEYLLAGRDFVLDLMALIDIIEPLCNLMLRAQKLNRPGWLILEDYKSVIAVWDVMEMELKERKFNKMKLMKDNFKDILIKKLKNVTLLDGWTFTGEVFVEENNKRRKVCNWDEREVEDCIRDLLKVIRIFRQFLKISIKEKVPEIFKELNNIFDFEGVIPCLAQSQRNEVFVSAFQKLSSYARTLAHFKIFKDTDFKMAAEKFQCFCKRLFFGDLNMYLPKVINFSNGFDKNKNICEIKVRSVVDSGLNREIIVIMTTGEEFKGQFNLDTFIKLIYCDAKIFNSVGNLFTAIFDLYFSKAGTEIVCETFFKYVENHLMEGSQNNNTLFLRSKIDFCSPNVTQCEEMFLEAANLFISGSKKYNLSKHLHPVNPNFKNKVFERLQNQPVKFTFLLDKKNK